MEAGIVRTNAERIARQVEPLVIVKALNDFWEAKRDGSDIGPGALAKILLTGGEVGKVRSARRPAPVEFHGSPTREPEPPRDVAHVCEICRTEYIFRSDTPGDCPCCGSSTYEQTIPALVAKRILPASRLERLPTSARDLLATAKI